MCVKHLQKKESDNIEPLIILQLHFLKAQNYVVFLSKKDKYVSYKKNGMNICLNFFGQGRLANSTCNANELQSSSLLNNW